MTEPASSLLYPPGASHLTQGATQQNNTSPRKQTQTVTSFPPTLALVLLWAHGLPVMPQTGQARPTSPSQGLWNPRDSLLQGRLFVNPRETNSPATTTTTYPPITAILLPPPHFVFLCNFCQPTYSSSLVTEPSSLPAAPPVEGKLHESRDLAWLFEGCPASAWNSALHTAGLKHGLNELGNIQLLG